MDKLTFPVSGMTCAACQARVQKTLAAQPGVADAVVSLMANEAEVASDPAPSRTAFEDQEAQDRAQEREFRDLRRKAAVAMFVLMPFGHGLHWIEMAMALVVMLWAGRDFYTRA